MEWINKPFVDAIEYFTAMLFTILHYAVVVGTLTGLVGIVWHSVQLMFGTMETQKFVVGTITKFALFIIIINMYPLATHLLQSGAISLGKVASVESKDIIVKELLRFQEIMEDVVMEEDAQAAAQLAANIATLESLTQSQNNYADTAYMGVTQADLAPYIADAQRRVSEAESVIATRQDNPSSALKNIIAIKSILKKKDVDGNVLNEGLTSSYFVDLDLYDADDNSTGYISPSAVLRIGTLCAQIMIEKEWASLVSQWEENDQKGFWSRLTEAKAVTAFPVSRLFDMILCFLCAIAMVLIIIGTLIQYAMCVIEFVIVVSFAAFCIPMMLFDGLKDVASKILPALLAQAAKLAIITMTIYYAIWVFLDLTVSAIGNTSNFNITTFGYVMFTVLLAATVCLNGPKLAVALMTGQPQLSMGELVATMGSAVAAGAGTAKAVKNTAKTGLKAAASGSRFATNRAGDVAAMAGAGMAVRQAGGNAFDALGAAAGEGLYRTGQKTKSALHGFAHSRQNSSSMGGGSGAGGAGVNRFGYNNEGYDAKDYLSQSRSMNYGNATVGKTGKAMTAPEFVGSQYKAAHEKATKNFQERQERRKRTASYTGKGAEQLKMSEYIEPKG